MSLDGTTSRWIDDLELEEEPASRQGSRRRSGLLLVGATVPWLLVVALLVLPGRIGTTEADPSLHDEPGPSADGAGGTAPEAQVDGSITIEPADAAPDPSTDGRDDADHDPHHDADPGTSPAAPHGSATDPAAELHGAWRADTGAEEAAALAIVLARAWLTTLEPAMEFPGASPPPGQRYAEHLVVEAVERSSREAAVVTVLAVVLEGEATLEAHVRRLAVPVVWDDGGPRPGGRPWPLAAPSLTPQTVATTPVDDPADHEAVGEALARAGYLDIEVAGVAASATGTVVAEVRGTTADDVTVDGPIWLRPHLEGYVVAGTTLAGPGPGSSPTAVDGDATGDAEGAAG